MAFTANTAFEARITNNQFDALCNVAGLYQVSSNPADCDAGRLVKRSAQAPCEGFSGVYNENTWIMVDAESTDTVDEVIYACNTYDTQLLTAADGNNYFVGMATLGLGVPAGRYGNFTKINFDNQSVYRIGVGNTSGTIGTNKYFTIDDGEYATAASAPATAGAIYFEIVGTGNFVEGTSNSFVYYDVRACKVSA